MILFFRANYNNRLLLNNLTRRLESYDVDEKKQNELNGSVELNLICLIAVRSNMRTSTAGVFCSCQTFWGSTSNKLRKMRRFGSL